MNINKFVIIWVVCLFAILPFSPLFFFILSIFTLIFFPVSNIPFLRFLLLISSLSAQLFIFYSIDFSESPIIDYKVYSEANLIVKNLSFSELFFEPFGAEFGWGMIFWLLNKLGVNVDGFYVSFYNSLICIFLFLIWFERYGLKDIDAKYHGLVSASTLLFFSFFTITFLQRQALSVVLLLFAISNKNNKKFYFFLIISSFFHITSLVVGLIYKFLMNIKFSTKKMLVLFFAIIIFRLLFKNIMILLSQFSFLEYKTSFYSSLQSFEIVSFRLALYSVLLLFLIIFFGKDIKSPFKNIIYFTAICSFSLLGINLASERLNFILIYLYGYFLFLILYEKNLKLLIILNVLFLLIYTLEKSSLVETAANHWSLYPPYSSMPFYYLIF